jgi:glucuronokinase
VRIFKNRAFARAGLLGNPSDGYFGKTISVVIRDFSASVVLYEWPELEIILSRQDRCQFNRIEELVEDVKLNGLYGGLRLIKASIKVFAEYCSQENLQLPRRNFSLRYETNIPRQVGLAGSSAIITAVFRGLMQFYEVQIRNEILANLILSVETKEIGIAAGLQDRVCQVYQSLVYMDFNQKYYELNGYGRYEVLDPHCLPPLYLAYRRDLSQISGIYHSNLRQRWLDKDPDVLAAMERFAQITEEGREALLVGNQDRLAQLMNQNFDTRAGLVQLDPANVEMVHLARKLGVCAKYAGSGGSIVGICPEEKTFERLQTEFEKIGCEVIRPRVSID